MDENFNINPDAVDLSTRVVPRDPFASQWLGPVYVNEAYKLNFNKLLHLAPYSELLQLSGPVGVGKTTLLLQFVISAKKSWKVVYIRTSSLMTREELLREVIHGFGLVLAVDHLLEAMLKELGRYLQAVARSGRRVMVVIDDFHLLADEVVAVVERILSDEQSNNAISVVLGVGDGAVLKRLDSFSILSQKLAYTLRLEPLAQSDMVGYIHHRLNYSGNEALQIHFGAELIIQLHKKSAGLPGKINELARAHLNKMVGRTAVTAVQGRALVRGGLILIAIALVGAVLLFQEQINRWITAPTAAVTPLAGLAIPTVVESVDELESQAVEPVVVAGNGESEAETLNMGALADQPESFATPGLVVEVPSESEVIAVPIPIPPVSISPPTVAATAAPPAKPVVEATPVEVAKKPAAKVPEKRSPKPVQGEGEEDWLVSQQPQHFTLQLMALIDEPQVRQFIAKHKLQGQSGVFYINRKGQRLTAIVYGSYPTRAAADEAGRALPAGWGVKNPWVRTFASISGEARPN